MPSVRLGTTPITAVRLGATPAKKLYLGTSLIWQPAAVFLDDFNRADSASLGPNWSADENTGDITGATALPIVDNRIVSMHGHPSRRYLPSSTLTADQWAECELDMHLNATLTADDWSCQGPAVRMNSSPDIYYWWMEHRPSIVPDNGPATGGPFVAVFCRQSNVWHQVGPSAVVTTANRTCKARIEAQGSTIRAYLDDVLIITGTDTTLSAGFAGIYGGVDSSGGPDDPDVYCIVDNFRCGNLPYTPVATGPQTWTGSTGTVAVTGTSGTWAAAQVWTGSPATVTVAGTSGTWSVGTPAQTWTGSTGTVAVTGTSGTWAAAQVWTGSTATAAVTATSGTWATVVPGGTFYTDNFNRANSGSLGSPWSSSNLSIASNAVSATVFGYAHYVGTPSHSADQWSELDVISSAAGFQIAPSVRMTSSTTGYYAWIDAGPAVSIYRLNDFAKVGSSVSIGSYTAKLRIEAQGTTLRLYVNGTLTITGTDSTFPSGNPGLLSYTEGSLTVTGDNWRGGNLPYTP
jgi:hypothetical protein